MFENHDHRFLEHLVLLNFPSKTLWCSSFLSLIPFNELRKEMICEIKSVSNLSKLTIQSLIKEGWEGRDKTSGTGREGDVFLEEESV